MGGDGAGALAFWLAVGAMWVAFLAGPIGQAVGRWIESKARSGLKDDEREELRRLAVRVAELEQVEGRLLEVEERVDFTERMLARGPAPGTEADTPPEPADAVSG